MIRKGMMAAVMAVAAVATVGQTPLYIYDGDRAEAAAATVISSVITDSKEQLAHKEAVKAAFLELLPKKAKTVEYFRQLEENVTSLDTALEARRKAVENLSNNLKNVGKTSAGRVTDPAMDEALQKQRMIDSLLTVAKAENERLMADKAKADSLNGVARHENGTLVARVDSLNRELGRVAADEDVAKASRALELLDVLRAEVKNSSAPLADIDVARMRAAVKGYADNAALIADNAPKEVKAAEANVKKLNATIAQAEAVQSALAHLRSRYDKAENEKLVKSFDAAMKTADKSRLTEMKAISEELNDFDRANRNINYLLNNLAETYGDSGTAGVDMAEYVNSVVGYFSSDSKYPAHYEVINSVAEKVRNAKAMSGPDVKKFVDNLKKEL